MRKGNKHRGVEKRHGPGYIPEETGPSHPTLSDCEIPAKFVDAPLEKF